MGSGQVRAGGVEGVDEVGGVVVGEGRVELVEQSAGGGGEVGEGGDLAGDAAQVGGVTAGPFGLGAVGGAAFAGGLDALFAGSSRGAGPASQMSERPLGVFSRQIVLADTLDTEHIEADYDAGVLTLRIPIAERARPRKIAIGGGSGRREISG